MVFPIIDAVALIFRAAFLAKVQKASKDNPIDVKFDLAIECSVRIHGCPS